jgi:hypothetical protein
VCKTFKFIIPNYTLSKVFKTRKSKKESHIEQILAQTIETFSHCLIKQDTIQAFQDLESGKFGFYRSCESKTD